MFSKRFLFVSLLAPGMSFASTATDSLGGTIRDVFDNLNENPAHVNVEGGKRYLRIGKEAGAQMIRRAGEFGLGFQINWRDEASIVNGKYSSSEAAAGFEADSTILTNTAKDLAGQGMPLAVSLGQAMGDLKWGLRIGYQSAKNNDVVTTTAVDPTLGVLKKYTGYYPTYSAWSARAGVISGDIEAAFAYGKTDWKLSTVRTNSDGDVTTANDVAYMEDGVSAQSTSAYQLVTRYTAGRNRWFLTYDQVKVDLEMWDLNDAKSAGTAYEQSGAIKHTIIDFGAEREYGVAEGMRVLTKSWFGYGKITNDQSKDAELATDMHLSNAIGLEVAAASWATLRAGVKGTFWGNTKTETTNHETTGRRGKTETAKTQSTYVMRFVSSPTMGVGFKFGNYMVDATLAQDGTGNIGFSEKILGKVEVTAAF